MSIVKCRYDGITTERIEVDNWLAEQSIQYEPLEKRTKISDGDFARARFRPFVRACLKGQ
jgi:hypothetical protein